jgi:hypothetical protein
MLSQALELERYLIEPRHWYKDQSWLELVPPDVIEELDTSEQPTGLGRHPTKGWFVLGTGQGPFIVWSEWEI